MVAVWAAIKGFAGRWLTGAVLKWIAGAAIAGGLAWFWIEFKDRGHEIAMLTVEKQQLINQHEQAMATAETEIAQAREDLADARATAERRRERADALAAEIREIESMERSDEEQELGCTLHPAIDGAVERLRQRRNPDSNEDQGS